LAGTENEDGFKDYDISPNGNSDVEDNYDFFENKEDTKPKHLSGITQDDIV
jgi:hypothetical protein